MAHHAMLSRLRRWIWRRIGTTSAGAAAIRWAHAASLLPYQGLAATSSDITCYAPATPSQPASLLAAELDQGKMDSIRSALRSAGQ